MDFLELNLQKLKSSTNGLDFAETTAPEFAASDSVNSDFPKSPDELSPLGFWHREDTKMMFLQAFKAIAHPHNVEKASQKLAELLPELVPSFEGILRSQVVQLTAESDVTEALQCYFTATRPSSHPMRLLRRGANQHIFIEKVEQEFHTYWLDQRFHIEQGRLKPMLEALPLVFGEDLELAVDRLQMIRLTSSKMAVFVAQKNKIQGFRLDLKNDRGLEYFELPEIRADQDLWFAVLRNQVVLVDRNSDETYLSLQNHLREALYQLRARGQHPPDADFINKLRGNAQLVEFVYTGDRSLSLLLQEIRVLLQKSTLSGYQDLTSDLELL